MRRVATVSAQWPPVYLAIGDSFDIIANFTLQTGLTGVDVAFGSGSGSFSEISRALDPTSAIDFVFTSENDIGEQYQINSLTVTIPNPVPEPSTMLLLGFGLAGLGFFRRRRKAA